MFGPDGFIDDNKHSKEHREMRGTRNDFDDDDDVNDENDALFFTDGEASRWWWRLCFRRRRCVRLRTREEMASFRGTKLAYARAEIEEKRTTRPRAGETARNARGEKRRMWGKSIRVLFGGRSAARSGWRAVADSRFLDLFFVVVFELSSDGRKECCCPFSSETKRPTKMSLLLLSTRQQVEEETNPQIETQAQKMRMRSK